MSDKPASPRGIPVVAMSSTTTLVNKTGSWKYIRPMYRDRIAPCNAACPVGIDIEGYMNFLRLGQIAEARDLLLRENPMPAVTGRVCHHPCEGACNRQHFDGAVSIHAVERVLGDMELEADPPLPVPRKHTETVAVIGSGPAGLACAYHLARLGYPVVVYEEDVEPGGMLRLGIPEYRLPRSVLDRQISRIESQGVTIRCGVRVGEQLGWDELGADAVFVASGAHRGRRAGFEGEADRRVLAGLEFLKRVNAGERPELGRRVVVVGGGNTAMDCARTALRLGATVLVVYRRTRAEMPAIEDEIEDAAREGVEFEFLAAPIKTEASDDVLVGVHCQRMKLGDPDESGRRRPVPSGEPSFLVECDTVLTAIGESTDLDFLRPDVGRADGGIRVAELGATSAPAVFAGGDAANEPRTVADALGSGKRAAVGIDRYLRRARGETIPAEPAALRLGASGNVLMTRWRGDDPVYRVSPLNEVVELEDLNLNHFIPARRHDDHRGDGVPIGRRFAEANAGLTREESMLEAARCFNCAVCTECELCLIFCPDVAISRRADGRFEVDLDYCKGCGVCAVECPRGAIVMSQEGL